MKNQSTTAQRTVLIVEDNSAINGVLKTLLELEGYRVIVAREGREGIEALRREPPDVIVLDMMMPGMNGWHFLDYQKAESRFAKIPVIVISAFGEIARSVRPDAYLPKPLKLELLLETIQKLSA